MNQTDSKEQSIFQQNGGILRTKDALNFGVHPRKLYQLRDAGKIIEISRGVFQLAGLGESNNSDLVAVSLRVPDAVICLVSALSFHELTTEIPHEVYLAIPSGKENPKIDFPPVRFFHFSDNTISAGVENHFVSGVDIKVFSAEKTIADCFKFRNKIGIDVAVEGLKMCISRNGARAEIIEYARLCRVEKVISPYLQAID